MIVHSKLHLCFLITEYILKMFQMKLVYFLFLCILSINPFNLMCYICD